MSRIKAIAQSRLGGVSLDMEACPERDELIRRVKLAALAAETFTVVTIYVDTHVTNTHVEIAIEADSSDVFKGGPIHTARQRRVVGAAYRVLSDALDVQTREKALQKVKP